MDLLDGVCSGRSFASFSFFCNVENDIQKHYPQKNKYFCIFLPTSIVELDGLKTQISLTKMIFTKFTYHCILTLFFLFCFIYFILFPLTFYFDVLNSSVYALICFFFI